MSSISIPQVIGHRGACAYCPENTLASFLKAYELGCQWVEFDVKLTKDNELIVFHDDDLDRTTNGFGPACDKTLSEIQQLDAGSWFSPEFSHEKVSTLKEMVEFLSQHNMGANIEIKSYPGYEQETGRKTIELVNAIWPSYLPQPLFSSFKVDSLRAAREVDSTIALGLLTKVWDIDWEHLVEEFNCISIHVLEKILDQQHIDRVKSKNLKLLSFTVNDHERAAQLFSWGVDAVFSDCPDKI